MDPYVENTEDRHLQDISGRPKGSAAFAKFVELGPGASCTTVNPAQSHCHGSPGDKPWPDLGKLIETR